MNKINLGNQLTISQKILEQILKKYNIYEFTFEEIKSGVENTSFIIKTKENNFVLRVYRKSKKTNQMIEEELQFQEYLRTQKIPIPYVFPNINSEKLTLVEIDGTVWQTILMQYLGETYFKSYTSELIFELATIQAKMHEAGFTFAKKQRKHKRVLTELKETLADRYSITNVRDKNILDFVQRAKEFYLPLSTDLSYGYNHLDYDTHGNVLVKNNKITAILDFDDLSYSPSVVCLGYTLWHVLFDSDDIKLVRKYLSTYENIRPLTKEEQKILPKIILSRNYFIGIIDLMVKKNYKHIQHFIDMEKIITNLKFDD